MGRLNEVKYCRCLTCRSTKFVRNCLPATLLATRKVCFLGFMRTTKPLSMRSRNKRPSLKVLRLSKASVISTIGIDFSVAKRGPNPQLLTHFHPNTHNHAGPQLQRAVRAP